MAQRPRRQVNAPYLADVPQLPDQLLQAIDENRLTGEQRAEADRIIAGLRQIIRAARERYGRRHHVRIVPQPPLSGASAAELLDARRGSLPHYLKTSTFFADLGQWANPHDYLWLCRLARASFGRDLPVAKMSAATLDELLAHVARRYTSKQAPRKAAKCRALWMQVWQHAARAGQARMPPREASPQNRV